jgi:prevent-host-death family protein
VDDHTFNIAEVKIHHSRLIERVERGDEIVIARNHRPVAVIVPARRPAAEILARIDCVRERIRKSTGGTAIREVGESWRAFVETGHRL